MNIQYCIDMAAKQPYVRKQSRHYAIVMDKKGRVVGEGTNEYFKSHPLSAKAGKAVGLPDKICIHAELKALLADRQRKGVKLIVARVDSKGQPAYSEPCLVCKHLLQTDFKHIKSIEFTI